MGTIIQVFYGDDPLYIADLYLLCISDGYLFTLSETRLFAHEFPNLSVAQEFAQDYLTGRKVNFIEKGALDSYVG